MHHHLLSSSLKKLLNQLLFFPYEGTEFFIRNSCYSLGTGFGRVHHFNLL